MPKIEQKEFDRLLKEGKKVEGMFSRIFPKTFEATREQDMREHWDVGIRVDVKKIKKTNRQDNNENENIHWVEVQNVYGQPGWAKGKADYIAFETEDYFVVVDREKLLDMTRLKVQANGNKKGNGLYEIYTRERVQDQVIKVKTIDLCAISTSIIPKN